ncbi:MAG: hypothetical protein IPO02_09125 [Bacteroidetes bacterium]|nr:hypothetical protein [Bacteroidota bacterium]
MRVIILIITLYIYGPDFTGGNSNICDTNGNLILYSDGFNIYDSAGNYIDDGDTIVPASYYNQYMVRIHYHKAVFSCQWIAINIILLPQQTVRVIYVLVVIMM